MADKYLGVIYVLDNGVGPQSFSLSREFNSFLSKEEIIEYLASEAHATPGFDVDSILVIKNGDYSGDAPQVVEFWTAAAGDFGDDIEEEEEEEVQVVDVDDSIFDADDEDSG
jgi:hypothetical protein